MENGKIIQVMGPLVDFRCDGGALPESKHAMEGDNHRKLLVM